MPELDDNTGEIDFGNLTLADLINQEDDKKTPESSPKTDAQPTTSPNTNDVLINRLAVLEQENTKTRNLLGQLVSILSKEDEPKQEDLQIDVGNEFTEPEKVKDLVSTITQAVSSQFEKLIEKKFGPSMKAIENVNTSQKIQNDLVNQYNEFKMRNPDIDNYALGMRYLNAQGASSEFQVLYNLAKNFGLTNDRFAQKPQQQKPKEDDNVRQFPPRVESSSVDTTTPTKITTARDAIKAALREYA